MNQKEEAKKHAFKNGVPLKGVVIKPLDLSLGKGVFVNVTEKNFDSHWDQCVNIMMENGRNNDNGLILVQDFMEGFEVCATILEGNLISIVARVPAFIIGDGDRTIEQLINQKNKMREECGFLSKNLIKKSEAVKAFIGNENLSFESIPEKDEYVLLLSVSNTSFGGEIVELTSTVSEQTRQLALDALSALPSMMCGGIDIIIKNFKDKSPRVIEINPFPVLALTTYPTYGNSSNPFIYYVEAIYTRDKLLNSLSDDSIKEKPKTRFFGLFKSSKKFNSLDSNIYIRNYFKYFERQHEMTSKKYLNMK